MVSGFAPVWQRAACGLWHGHRALHRLDVRHRAYPRNNSVSEDVVSHQALAVRQTSVCRQLAVCVVAAEASRLGDDKLKFVGHGVGH